VERQPASRYARRGEGCRRASAPGKLTAATSTGYWLLELVIGYLNPRMLISLEIAIPRVLITCNQYE
jgi:hypothetical protein